MEEINRFFEANIRLFLNPLSSPFRELTPGSAKSHENGRLCYNGRQAIRKYRQYLIKEQVRDFLCLF